MKSALLAVIAVAVLAASIGLWFLDARVKALEEQRCKIPVCDPHSMPGCM